MTLLVDVGNSAIKWARLDTRVGLHEPHWLLHRGVFDLESQLIAHWRGSVERGAPVVACNVAGARLAAIVEAAALSLHLSSVRWLRAQPHFNGPIVLSNGYRDPTQLGADRWHCMLGAGSVSAFPLIVVNAGTATTVDCIDAVAGAAPSAGRFVGGFIAPGVRLMRESLARETAGLPAARGVPAQFPDNTDAAIVSGVFNAQVGLVNQVWQRFGARSGAAPHLIFTGGNAEELRTGLAIDAARIEHNLVLRGLALRAQPDVTDSNC